MMTELFRIAIFSAVIGTVHVMAASIPGIFNTGVDNNGTLLSSGSVDPHYRITRSADAAAPGPNSFVINEGFPIPPWVANGPASKWIGPQAAQGTGNLPGDYTYRTTFNLTNFDITT